MNERLSDQPDRRNASLEEAALVEVFPGDSSARLGRFGRQTERARRQRERVAWTLVGVVGIDPGEAVAAGWPGPHLKDEGCLPSLLSTARPSPCLSLSTSPSRTLTPTTMRGRAGEKRKRRREQRNHVSGVLVSQEKERERERGEPPSASVCTKDIILLFVMSGPIKPSKKHWASMGEICECRPILRRQTIRLCWFFGILCDERERKTLCSFFLLIFFNPFT